MVYQSVISAKAVLRMLVGVEDQGKISYAKHYQGRYSEALSKIKLRIRVLLSPHSSRVFFAMTKYLFKS